MTSTSSTTTPVPTAPELPADLTAGLRRLKLSTIRAIAPEVLITAKTQRWTPEEVLRTLLEAELAARDASNTANRLKAAGSPSPRRSKRLTSQHLPFRQQHFTTWPTWNGSPPKPTSR